MHTILAEMRKVYNVRSIFFVFQHVGCDHRLESNASIDECGVCGGNDSCLHDNEILDKQDNLSNDHTQYKWLNLGFGACSTTCGVGNKLFNIIYSYLYDVHVS